MEVCPELELSPLDRKLLKGLSLPVVDPEHSSSDDKPELWKDLCGHFQSLDKDDHFLVTAYHLYRALKEGRPSVLDEQNVSEADRYSI